jgi:hypothetical protein
MSLDGAQAGIYKWPSLPREVNRNEETPAISMMAGVFTW